MPCSIFCEPTKGIHRLLAVCPIDEKTHAGTMWEIGNSGKALLNWVSAEHGVVGRQFELIALEPVSECSDFVSSKYKKCLMVYKIT